MTEAFNAPEPIAEITFIEHDFSVQAEILRVETGPHESQISVRFENVTIAQSRHFVQMLYARMMWWKQRKQPGATDSILAMLTVMLQARPVLNRYSK